MRRVQPIFNGNGKSDLTGVMFTYEEAREILTAYAYQMSPPELYHARLREKLGDAMIIAFDNMFFQWFNDLSARSEVMDSFLGILIPTDPIDLEQMLCIELFALLRRFDAFVPFDVDIETWLTRRYDFTILEKHFEVPLIFPDAYVTFSNHLSTYLADDDVYQVHGDDLYGQGDIWRVAYHQRPHCIHTDHLLLQI